MSQVAPLPPASRFRLITMIPRPIALHRSFQAVTFSLALCLRCCGLLVSLAPSLPTLMPSGPSYLLSVYHSGFPGSSLPFCTLFQALALGFFPSFGVTYCSPLSLVSGATNIVNTLVFKSIGFGISGLQPYSCSLFVSFVYKNLKPMSLCPQLCHLGKIFRSAKYISSLDPEFLAFGLSLSFRCLYTHLHTSSFTSLVISLGKFDIVN